MVPEGLRGPARRLRPDLGPHRLAGLGRSRRAGLALVDESYGWVRIVLHEWPCAVGVLAATLHACGATEVGYDG